MNPKRNLWQATGQYLRCHRTELLKNVGVAFLGGLMALGVASLADRGPASISAQQQINAPLQLSGYADAATPNFTAASAAVTPAVVHIQSTYSGKPIAMKPSAPDPFYEFFGDRFGGPMMPQGPKAATGSGVILTQDGYIATNNHVIEGAEEIEVTLHDKRVYKATLIGADPSTDLALLKIEEKNLPFVPYGDSEAIKVGEWVLAVGNPFNLTSTVTAGIVSAKGRNLNLLSDKYRIESFIQTDAAVNPGNSGGALVDLKGQLVGINTAIASETGSYSGYSFAVPVTIVRKVMDDLKQYGEVQRGFLGVQIQDVNGKLADEKGLKVLSGAYIQQVNEGSAAGKAGVEPGDVIVKVDDQPVGSSAELQERIGLHRPGDVVKLTVNRSGTEKTFTVTLQNKSGTTEIAGKAISSTAQVLGADLVNADTKDLESLKIKAGVKVQNVKTGKLKSAGIGEGFIITHLNKKPVTSVDDVMAELKAAEGGILVEGVYPSGKKGFYALSF